MKLTILIAGGTGNLGRRIIKALIKRGAEVRAIVRNGSKPEKIAKLTELGAKVIAVDMSDVEQLKQAPSIFIPGGDFTAFAIADQVTSSLGYYQVIQPEFFKGILGCTRSAN